MSEMLFVSLDGKRVYESDEFTVEQYKYLLSVKEKLLDLHNNIVNVMRKTYEVIYTHNTWHVHVYTCTWNTKDM